MKLTPALSRGFVLVHVDEAILGKFKADREKSVFYDLESILEPECKWARYILKNGVEDIEEVVMGKLFDF